LKLLEWEMRLQKVAAREEFTGKPHPARFNIGSMSHGT
jgi:hypothetical protein